jgi:hypothetical protein
MEDATSRVWDCNRVTRGYGVDVRLVLVHDAGVEAVGVCGRGGSLPLLPLVSSEVNIQHMCVFIIEVIRGEVVGVVWEPWVMVGWRGSRGAGGVVIS